MASVPMGMNQYWYPVGAGSTDVRATTVYVLPDGKRGGHGPTTLRVMTKSIAMKLAMTILRIADK